MLITTTPTVAGQVIEDYLRIVAGEAVMGVNAIKDLFAGMRDVVGGRSKTYEKELGRARAAAIRAMRAEARSLGAHAIVGVDIDYEVLGQNNGMLMVTACGTAVRFVGVDDPDPVEEEELEAGEPAAPTPSHRRHRRR